MFVLWEGPNFEQMALTGTADTLAEAIFLHFDAPEGECAQIDELLADTSLCRVTITTLPA